MVAAAAVEGVDVGGREGEGDPAAVPEEDLEGASGPQVEGDQHEEVEDHWEVGPAQKRKYKGHRDCCAQPYPWLC